MKKYPCSVFRVEIDYLSKNYDDSMLSTSTAYGENLDAAKKAYNDAIRLFCVDDKTKHVRVTLTETFFPAPLEWGKTKVIRQNY